MAEWTEWEEVVMDSPHSDADEKVWVNDRYQVRINTFESGITWLSIKRTKKEHIHDWRELLRIKNELTHPDREAVELYPGMFRVVDTSNQYHLFVLPLGLAFNLGYIQAHIEDDMPDRYEFNKGRQRPLPGWMPRVGAGDRNPTAGFATGGDGEGGLQLTFPMDLNLGESDD